MSLSRTVSDMNGDFSRRSPIFPHPRVFNAQTEGVPLGIGYWHKGWKNLEWWGYQKVDKSFKIGLAIQTQYRRVTDKISIQTHDDSKDRADA